MLVVGRANSLLILKVHSVHGVLLVCSPLTLAVMPYVGAGGNPQPLSARFVLELMMHLCFQSWNHFSDSEAERVKMMEEVEKLCDRLELARYVRDSY